MWQRAAAGDAHTTRPDPELDQFMVEYIPGRMNKLDLSYGDYIYWDHEDMFFV